MTVDPKYMPLKNCRFVICEGKSDYKVFAEESHAKKAAEKMAKENKGRLVMVLTATSYFASE